MLPFKNSLTEFFGLLAVLLLLCIVVFGRSTNGLPLNCLLVTTYFRALREMVNNSLVGQSLTTK